MVSMDRLAQSHPSSSDTQQERAKTTVKKSVRGKSKEDKEQLLEATEQTGLVAGEEILSPSTRPKHRKFCGNIWAVFCLLKRES